MIKKILVVLVLVIAAVLAYAAIQPDTFRLQRSASIAATPERLYPLIADGRRSTPGTRGCARTRRAS